MVRMWIYVNLMVKQEIRYGNHDASCDYWVYQIWSQEWWHTMAPSFHPPRSPWIDGWWHCLTHNHAINIHKWVLKRYNLITINNLMTIKIDGWWLMVMFFRKDIGGWNDISHKAIWRMFKTRSHMTSGKHPAGDTLRMRPLLKCARKHTHRECTILHAGGCSRKTMLAAVFEVSFDNLMYWPNSWGIHLLFTSCIWWYSHDLGTS